MQSWRPVIICNAERRVRQTRRNEYKLMAVPTARVARMLAPLTFSTGLQLAGGVAPKPPFHPSTYIYTKI